MGVFERLNFFYLLLRCVSGSSVDKAKQNKENVSGIFYHAKMPTEHSGLNKSADFCLIADFFFFCSLSP